MEADAPGRPDQTVKDQAGDELRRLRDAAPDQRREVLADLGSRLAALVRHLTATGVAVPADLQELAAALADDAPLSRPDGELAALWERTVSTLERLAGGARSQFWKA
jgi:hypothetical protein